MPALMNINEFVAETREDFNSPTTSTFVNKMSQCRQTVGSLEESLDFDRDGLTEMKKAVKAIFNGGNSHTLNEIYFSKALEKLGANAMTKDQELDIGAAFIKFSIVTKELSALMKTLMQNLNNIVMFPLDNILKGDLKGVKGDLKKPFDKAWRDYEAKITKIEKEKKQQAKEAGLIRTEISPAEIADEMNKERKYFQLQMCEYLIKVNEIKTKKGAELLQHLVEYYNAQTNYFRDGLKTIEHFNGYINELSVKLQRIRQKQDEERTNLVELRNLLKLTPLIDNNLMSSHSAGDRKDSSIVTGYSLHQMQGNKHYGYSKAGYLLKKSEGKMRVKVWQKRKCEVRDGFLYIYHSDESKPPTKINLLTCQVKAIADDKKFFDLVSYNRTYHFQAEDENEMEAWTSVLINCKEGALKKEFDNNNATSGEQYRSFENQSLRELQQSIIKHVQKLPGNDKCVDCSSTKDPTWLSTNFGVVTCIECSGIHRDMGVHVSRIQSLTLDNIGTSQLLLARVMSNTGFNDIMEATLNISRKLTPTSTMEERNEFIRAKYIDRRFAIKTCADENDLKNDLEHAIMSRHLHQLLQAFVEGADLTWVLPGNKKVETGLHVAVVQENGSSLHIVDFLVQNSKSLDKTNGDGNTALHLCALHNRPECMKLLLRSGANINIKNHNGKTPLDLAKAHLHTTAIELLESAAQNKKMLFENVNIEYGFLDDAITDFSDEDLADDKQQVTSVSTPIDRLPRSRPSSVVGSESPSIRSSENSFKQPQSGGRGKVAHAIANLQGHHGGSIKKRTPGEKESQSTTSLNRNHCRNASDSGISTVHSYHWRNNSVDLASGSNGTPDRNLTMNSVKAKAQLFSQNSSPPTDKNAQLYGTLTQRPRCPPPPAPQIMNSPQSQLSNGQSIESLPSVTSENEECSRGLPVPPPRKREGRIRRCRAVYDCEADREDELAFKEGEIIVIINETTDDDEWMEGAIEGDRDRRGVFPVSFVEFLPE